MMETQVTRTSRGNCARDKSHPALVLNKIRPHDSVDGKGIKPGHAKGNQSWIFSVRTDAEAPILGPPEVKSWLVGKDPDAGKGRRREEKGKREDEGAGRHHWLDGHEFKQALGDGDRQGGLACCSPWGHRVGHDWPTELTWTEAAFLPSWNSYKSQEREA